MCVKLRALFDVFYIYLYVYTAILKAHYAQNKNVLQQTDRHSGEREKDFIHIK